MAAASVEGPSLLRAVRSECSCPGSDCSTAANSFEAMCPCCASLCCSTQAPDRAPPPQCVCRSSSRCWCSGVGGAQGLCTLGIFNQLSGLHSSIPAQHSRTRANMENAGFSFPAPASPAKAQLLAANQSSPRQEWSIKAASRIPGPPPSTPGDQKTVRRCAAVTGCRRLPPVPLRIAPQPASPPPPSRPAGRPLLAASHPKRRGPTRGDAAEARRRAGGAPGGGRGGAAGGERSISRSELGGAMQAGMQFA